MQFSKAELAFIANSIKAASKLYEPEGVDVENLRDRINRELHTREGRCPHDGATCRHACENRATMSSPDGPVPICYRRAHGMSLTTPHEGYPKRGT